MKKFETIVPIMHLIGSLFKAKFCNALRYPISKPTRANPSDSDMINQFVRICIIFLIVIMDPKKKKSLYRIKYILQLSCVKTLARKHKSIVRFFFKRLGLEFLEEFLMEEEVVLSLIFKRSYSTSREFYSGKIWYFDITCINDLVNY